MKFPYVFIGTYHKTGCVWMINVFTQAAKELGVPFIGPELENIDEEISSGLLLDSHCQCPDFLRSVKMRGFRLIRDPRDIVISGAHYHTKSQEPWLSEAQGHLAGKSYQQAINALESWQARYRFEMKFVAKHTINSIIKGPAIPLRTVHYETLMEDTSHKCFADLARYLGFRWFEHKKVMKAYKRWSLNADGKLFKDVHGRSGKVAQWRQTYSRKTAEAFMNMHGDALITLGYEKDHSWVENCNADE